MLNDKCSMINGRCSGFSLLELLVVVAIMAMSAALMAPAIGVKSDQKLTERTIVSMEEIKKAILGVTCDRVRGDVKFAGYVLDMGFLPGLYDVQGTPDDPSDDQPKALWTYDPEGTPDNEDDDLVSYRPYLFEPHGSPFEIIRIGWRGPYIKPPANDALEDGWRNPFRFQNINGVFTIISLGADNKEGGEGFDRDITLAIQKSDYTTQVSGYVSPQSASNPVTTVRISYAPGAGCNPVPIPGAGEYYLISDCKYMEKAVEPDGFFLFNSVPVGTQRLLMVTNTIGYKLALEPGILWLGTLGVMH